MRGWRGHGRDCRVASCGSGCLLGNGTGQAEHGTKACPVLPGSSKAERAAVNRNVAGSSPALAAKAKIERRCEVEQWQLTRLISWIARVRFPSSLLRRHNIEGVPS